MPALIFNQYVIIYAAISIFVGQMCLNNTSISIQLSGVRINHIKNLRLQVGALNFVRSGQCYSSHYFSIIFTKSNCRLRRHKTRIVFRALSTKRFNDN